MNEPIKVGDLVVVVSHPCCGSRLGRTGTVMSLHGGSIGSRCGACHKGTRILPYVVLDNHSAYPLAWLKRIPPLCELEGEKRDEEITA